MPRQDSANEATSAGLFNSLPTELLLNIFYQLSDLVSVDSLIHASATAYRAFNANHPADIIDHVLCHGYRRNQNTRIPVESGATHLHIRLMINLMAHIRTLEAPFMPLAKLLEEAGRLRTSERARAGQFEYFRTIRPDILCPEHLPAGISPTLVRSLLATARHIEWMTLDCLNFYLERFRAARPSRPIDTKRGFRRRATTYRKSYDLDPWGPGPVCQPFEVQDIGSPLWNEQQRVARAFWRIQLIGDMRKLAASGRLQGPPHNWPLSDIAAMERLQATDLDEFKEPVELSYIDLRATQPMEIAYNTWVRLYIPREYQETLSVLEYMQEVHGQSWPDQIPAPSHTSLNRPWPVPEHRPGDDRWLVGPSPGYKWFGRGNRNMPSRDFGSYRRLGFAFWSLERMQGHGLLPPGPWFGRHDPAFPYQHSDRARHRYHYTWRSLIREEDLVSLRCKEEEVMASNMQQRPHRAQGNWPY
jgi:hypothetical protein